MSNTPRIDRLEPNLLLNGDFAIWQRGTSNNSAANVYRGDRWRVNNIGGGNNHERSSDNPPLNSAYFHRMTFLAGGNAQLYQPMESTEVVRMLGKTFTLVFKARRSADIVGNLQVRLERNHVADSATTGNWVSMKTQNILNADIDTVDFTQFKISVTIPADSSILGFRPLITSTSAEVLDSTIDIAEVMLLPGDLTGIEGEIPFRLTGKNYADELHMCQRYFERANWQVSASGVSNTITNYSFKATKRANPTVTIIANISGHGGITANVDSMVSSAAAGGSGGNRIVDLDAEI